MHRLVAEACVVYGQHNLAPVQIGSTACHCSPSSAGLRLLDLPKAPSCHRPSNWNTVSNRCDPQLIPDSAIYPRWVTISQANSLVSELAEHCRFRKKFLSDPPSTRSAAL